MTETAAGAASPVDSPPQLCDDEPSVIVVDGHGELLAHLVDLAAAGAIPACVQFPLDGFTSTRPDEQAYAARVCRACPALTACREYGLTHPEEVGVYGGLTETDRVDLAAGGGWVS